MPRNVAAKTSSRDPLKTVADALDTAVKAAKEGATGTKATAGKVLPAAGPVSIAVRLHDLLHIFIRGCIPGDAACEVDSPEQCHCSRTCRWRARGE